MKTLKIAMIALLHLCLLVFLFILRKISLAEVRPKLNFQTNEEDTKTDYGFELTLGYDFKPNLGAYAGWGWNKNRSLGLVSAVISGLFVITWLVLQLAIIG